MKTQSEGAFRICPGGFITKPLTQEEAQMTPEELLEERRIKSLKELLKRNG